MELKDPAIESQEFFEFTISCSREVLSIVCLRDGVNCATES